MPSGEKTDRKCWLRRFALALLLVSIDPSLALRSGIPELSFRESLMNDQNFLLHFQCDAWVSCDVAMSSTYAQSSSPSPRYPLSDLFLPVFGTVDTGNGWKNHVCPRAIGGITTCHKMRHSLSLPTVTYICMRELPHFHHSPTTPFLHSQPNQTPPSGPGLVCGAGQMFIMPSMMI